MFSNLVHFEIEGTEKTSPVNITLSILGLPIKMGPLVDEIIELKPINDIVKSVPQ